MTHAWQFKTEGNVGILEFKVPAKEVNVLTSENMAELSMQLDAIDRQEDLAALVFMSAKDRIFIAGADIREIENIQTEDEAFRKAEEGKAVLQKIADLKMPTVCAINGACLGGGYELALACDWRSTADSDKVKIGLPEVNLGILPGFGGSIRLPRLLGLRASLPLILGGRMLSAKEALSQGLVDRLFPEKEFYARSVAWARELAEQRRKRPLPNAFKVFFEKYVAGPLVIYPAARKDILKRTKGFYPAPLEALNLIARTYGNRDPAVFSEESRVFARLAVTEVSKNLIQVFFLNERYKKFQWTSVEDVEEKTSQCGVVGAGVMGGGIAQLVTTRDLPVKVKDISEKALESARREAERIYQRALERGKITPEAMERKLGLIKLGASNEELARCEIIIEAVVEDLEIKKKVFKELSELTPRETILATNTSSLSVSQMAAVSRFSERVAGLHFFNPVHRMPLVEVIRANQTSEETLERLIRFARRLGKTVIVVKDAPGFLVNRLLMPYMNEAAYLMEEGLRPEAIDGAATAFGMPMGPIELVDQVGVDVAYKVAHVLQEAFGPRMQMASILETVKNQGALGKKTGRGFYVYDGKKKTVNPEFKVSATAKELPRAEIQKRLIFVMINEAARCLEEQVIDQPATVDVGMIFGTGFPPFRAGLLRYADSVGARQVVDALRRFRQEIGHERFEPSGFLVQLAETGKSFYPDSQAD